MAIPISGSFDIDTLNQLARSKDIQEQIELILKRNTVAISDNIKAVNAYVDEIKQLEKQQNILSSATNKLSTDFSVLELNLKTDIKYLDELNDTLQNKLNKSFKESADFTRTLSDILGTAIDQNHDFVTTITDAEGKIATYTNTFKTAYSASAEDIEKFKSNIEKYKDTWGLLTQTEKDFILENEAKKVGFTNTADAMELAKAVLQKTTAEQIKYNNELIRTIPNELSLIKVQQLRKDKLGEVTDATGKFVDKMFMASSQTNLFASAVIASTDGISNLGINMAGKFLDSFLKPEAAMNRFFNFLNDNLIKSTFDFDKALAQVNRETGGFRQEFEKVAMTGGPISGAAIGNLSVYGVNLEKLGKAYGALSNTINGFNNMADSQRKILMQNAATMENLGVSMDTYAGTVSKLMASVGKSADGAKNTINLLAREAIAAGRNVGEYVKEFEQLMPKIVGFGREATQIFKELNSLASMTKGVMSTGDLQNFASQFDNWDSAAEAASKLNVALGGASVNIADMMRADPAEKLMKLKEAYDASGVEFDKLNIGYKRMLAEAFGGDVAKAASFFNGSLAEANAKMQEAAATEEELAERKKQSVDAQEKLTKAIESMKLSLTPIINIVASIAEGIAGLNNAIGPLGTFLTVALPLGIVAAMGFFKLARAGVASVTGGVLSDLQKIITTANQARQAVNNVNTPLPGGPTPGTGPGPGTGTGTGTGTPATGFGFKSVLKGVGIATLIGGAIALASSTANNNTSSSVTNAQFLTNNNVPQTNDADFSSTRPIYTVNNSKNLVKLADTNARDNFASVRATTPESRSQELSIALTPIIKNSEERSERLIKELSQATLDREVIQKESFKEAISNVNVNVKMPKQIVAKIDPPAIETIADYSARKTKSGISNKVESDIYNIG